MSGIANWKLVTVQRVEDLFSLQNKALISVHVLLIHKQTNKTKHTTHKQEEEAGGFLGLHS